MGLWEVVEEFANFAGRGINPLVRIAEKPWFWAALIGIIILVFAIFLLLPFIKWIMIQVLCLIYGGC